jgi:hypothetical protein
MRLAMRLLLSTLAVAALTATTASADGMPRHAGPHSHARHHCGCHHAMRHRAHAWGHAAIHSEHYASVRQQGWSSDTGWRSRGWHEEEGEGYGYGASWGERHYTTDQYGYLDWPSKTHFVDGHYVEAEGPHGPPPPPEDDGGPGMGPDGPHMGPPPPPPPPSGDPDDGSYEVHRW